MKRTIIFGLAMAVSAGAGAAQWGFADYDVNNDDLVDEGEFEQGLAESELFGAWDLNDDEIITDTEWNERNIGSDFGEWDTDDDLGITEEEFNQGLYREYDENEDLALDETEWNGGAEEGWMDW